MGNILITVGILILVAGLFVNLFGGIPKLPGDILVKRENFTFYFPLGGSLALSIILSLVFWIINKF